MKELILTYSIPGLYIIGLLLMVIRYRRSRIAVSGFIAFVFFLIPFLLEWLLPETTWGSSDAESYLWVAFLIGLLIMIGTLTYMAEGVPKKANSVFIFIAVIVVLLTLIADAIIVIRQNGPGFMQSTIRTTLWISLVTAILAIFGSFNDPKSGKNKVLTLLGGMIIISLFVFAIVIFAKVIPGSWWMVIYVFQYLLTCIGFAACSFVILNLYASAWYGKIGVAAFIVLSMADLASFSLTVTNALSFEISEAITIVRAAGWFFVIIFFATVPASRVDSYPSGRGFVMTQTRGAGVVTMIVGAAICAWQFYELNSTDHFTFWVIKGFIPIPIILLGILLFLGGLIAFVKEDS